jgi:hypothetical protein
VKTVSPALQTTLPPVPLRQRAPFGTGLSVRVAAIHFGKVTQSGPGSLVGRPTVAFTLQLTNKSDKAVSIDAVQVSTSYGAANTPGVPSDSAPSRPFAGRLGSGDSTTGVYVFAIPEKDQHDVSLTVWYKQGVPTVLLHGSAR